MKYLRFVPLGLCLVAATLVSLNLLGSAFAEVLRAGGSVLLWAGWVGGPLVFVLCLAFLVRERRARVACDLALAGLTVVDLLAAGFSLLPFVPGRELMFYLPILQYFGLTALLGLVMLVRRGIPELAKKGGSGT